MVPYLGKFLTDLVMLDTALPAHVCTKAGRRLLNFEKCRKEFEILAQIRLYQSAAATYLIEPHDHFRFWFYKALRVLDSEDWYVSTSITITTNRPTFLNHDITHRTLSFKLKSLKKKLDRRKNSYEKYFTKKNSRNIPRQQSRQKKTCCLVLFKVLEGICMQTTAHHINADDIGI